ncbi:MAG: ABC exporter membrane fusion protein [Synechococcales cyanobacterium M58_A2018_015]|nr:ABC exporter membrane fusion protein [Synechococcales cyanobacterium M58_A2018_015]
MALGNKQWPRQRWLVVVVGGTIVLGLTGIGIARLVSSSQPVPEATETPLPQRVEVVALGRLEPEGEVIRIGGPSTERIGRLEVRQGDEVQQGDVLAYLESYEERRAERDYAASQLAEAEQRLQATTAYGQSQIQEAQTRIQQAQQPGTFEIEAQRARIRELEAQLALATEDLQRFQDLYAQGAVSKQTLDQQVTETRQAQEQLNNAQATLVRIEREWQADVRNAQAQLQSEQANLPLSQVQVQVESARQNLQLAAARLERTIIRAPQDGRILRIYAKAGEAIGDSGILDLGNTRQMMAVAEVYETDVSRVRVGQRATITSRNGAFDTPLTGTVTEIGWQIFKNNVLDDDPAANADARVVEVKIRLDDSRPVEALTNLQVDVRIDVEGTSTP